jgi:glycosyltransferase involved in cell wall biosynthesis
MEVNQLLPGLHPGDAISHQALTFKRLFRAWGHTSEIYSKDISYEVHDECRHFTDYRPARHSVTFYRYSLGSPEITDAFLRSPGKRVLIYHNITPHHYLEPYNAAVSQACKKGRETLAKLAEQVDLALADSGYNCRELAESGYRKPRVLPLLLDFREFEATPSATVLNLFSDDWTNFLFVGRVSPNKRHDDVIRVFARYNRWIENRSRLFLVGSWRGLEGYLKELREVAEAGGVLDHVFFLGHVPLEELAAYYRLADVFLCLSEHEGFCVPLLEAMHHEVPIIAYAAAAVPDTLGDAGILVARKDYPAIAELAHLLVVDQDLRDAVLRRQRQRLVDFKPEPIVNRLRVMLEELISL